MSGFRYRIDLDAGALSHRADAAARQAVAEAAEVVLARSNALAPRRSGALVGSARVETEGARARVRYGVPYARIQHEGIGFRHPRGGQAKFLAEAVQSPEAAEALKKAFVDALFG